MLHEVLVICLNHRKKVVFAKCLGGFYPPPLFSGLTKKIASSLRVFNTFMTLVHMFCTTVVHLSVWTVLCFWTFKCDPVIWALIFVTCFCRFVPQTKVYLEIFAPKIFWINLKNFTISYWFRYWYFSLKFGNIFYNKPPGCQLGWC